MQHSKETLKEKVIAGLFWKFLERGGTQAVQFILQIILARLLLPEDYGITGLLSVFIAIASIFVQSGLGSALIQRKHIDDVDCSSVFYLNLGIAVIFYGLLFWGAPAISSFYTEPLLTPVLRVQALVLLDVYKRQGSDDTILLIGVLSAFVLLYVGIVLYKRIKRKRERSISK